MYQSLYTANINSNLEDHRSLAAAVNRIVELAAADNPDHGKYTPYLEERHSALNVQMKWEVLGAPGTNGERQKIGEIILRD